MRLADYLEEEGLTLTAFAEKIDVSVETVRRYCDEGRIPIPPIMSRIIVASGGKVQPNDFFGEAA